MKSKDSRRRRILLLLCAVLIPGAVLVTLGIRVVRQETELAENRLADEQRKATEQLRRELSARLETIKLQETNRPASESRIARDDGNTDSAVVFTAPIDKDHLQLPWTFVERRRSPAAKFIDYQNAGETLEFGEDSLPSALNAYRYALASATSPLERCKANLWIGRTLLKTGKSSDAIGVYRAMLKDCDGVFDEESVPLSLYAAERMTSAGAADVDAADGARHHVLEKAAQHRWWSPVAAYLMRSLLTGMKTPEADAALANLAAVIRDGERVQALANNIQRLGLPELSFHISTGSNWLAYGDDPWLITIIPAGADRTGTAVLAVSARTLTPPGVRFLPANSKDGFLLGEGLTELRAEWQPGRFTARPVPSLLYGFGLALILAVTILVAYLLLRDVDREVRLAEMRSHFVASVSHELKTPLTAIRMFSETLVTGRTNNPESQALYLNTILNESERLSRLVDNVLDFARIEQDSKNYQMRTICLADVVRSATEAMQYPLARLNFELRVDVEDNLPSLKADPDAMEQAILNLLANAMKYSGESREIDLRLHRKSDEAVIEVTDHGLGIAEENHHRIFEKFYRVRSTETDRVPGAGLGLTLVMHAVTAHGGRLLVSSSLGSGSTFSIHLPFTKEETPA